MLRAEISIPYGAIKSRLTIENVRENHWISIPYGAIKRVSYFYDKFKALSFQFLMVRLKEKMGKNYKILVFISIPYGAIKSSKTLHFQLPANYFNSLWCDNIETGETGRLGA